MEAEHQAGFHARLARHAGATLVVFTQPGCGACRRVRALVEAGLPVTTALRTVEVDASENAALVAELEVFHLPALFLFRDGQFHAPIHAEATAAALAHAITAALEQPAQEPP